MKVLVTGATGFVGKSLVSALVRRGASVNVLSRDPEKAKESIGWPVAAFRWSSAAEPPPEALSGVTHVVHLAGESVANGRWTQEKKRRILDSRVESTRHLVAALNTHAPDLKAFVCALGIAYYGNDCKDLVLTEDSPSGEGFLCEVAKNWEDEANRCAARTVSVRIGLVLGHGGALTRMMIPFRFGIGGKIGDGRQWMSWIHLDDLVGMILHALDRNDLRGPLNGTSPNPVTNADFTKALSAQLRKPALVTAPATALRAGLGEMADLALGSQRVSPAKALATGYSFRYVQLEDVLHALFPTWRAQNDYQFTSHQWLNKPVEELFTFFSDARNLEKITPPWLQFRVLGGASGPVTKGQRINYQLRLRGIPIRWESLIEEWVPNELFVDMQTKGPYSHWRHTHTFVPVAGGTVISDEVAFRVPGGAVGRSLLGGWVHGDVEKIFRFRREAIHRELS